MMISFRKKMLDTNNHVLAIMGYGFNDEHINIDLREGIRSSNGALSVIAFMGTKDLPPTLNSWLMDGDLRSQVLILGKNGIWKDGKQVFSSDYDLDWYKFEYISDLLSGVR